MCLYSKIDCLGRCGRQGPLFNTGLGSFIELLPYLYVEGGVKEAILFSAFVVMPNKDDT